ncbi:MAG: hypothetical protein M1831_003835 [Alyxoria varia]|nr:MAG: hypothetical protein M1831_003835 [Alyxoria varia]
MDGSTSSTTPQARDVQTGEQALRPLFNVCVAFIVVDTVFFVLRFYAVLKLRRKRLSLTWDDWLLVPAYIMNLGMLANGLGKLSLGALESNHRTDEANTEHAVIQQYGIRNNSMADEPITDPNQNLPIWKCLFVITQLKNPTFAFTRFSLLALFLRLFRSRLVRLACYSLIVFVVAQTLAFNIAGIFQCSPIDYFWNQGYGVEYGTCFDFNMFYRALVPPEIFVDVVLIFLPLPEIWGLQSSRARKAGLTLVFLSGFLALMSNCARLASYWTHTIDGAVPSVDNAIVAWCNAEMSVTFIVACIPTMHPLFERLLPNRVRSEIRRRFSVGRQRMTPNANANSKPWVSVASSEGGFNRLKDSSGRSGSPGFGEPQRYDATADVRNEPGTGLEAARGHRVPNEIMDVEDGQGVLVKTEIMVTQEELLEDVLGF